MSLDVYLNMEYAHPVKAGKRIYIREDGQTKEITREEWDARYPGEEPVTVVVDADESRCVFDYNITHNLGKMADAAGIYKALWRPEEIGIKTARELIMPLRDGLAKLKASPEEYKKHSPPNGWGTYEGLVEFVSRYLAACEKYPDATVEASR